MCCQHRSLHFLTWIVIIISAGSFVTCLEPPRILLNDVDDLGSITVSASNSLSLTCEGEKPVRWRTHGKKTIDSRIAEELSDSPNVDGRYSSNLIVSNTVYTDTGPFSCRFQENIDSSDPEHSTEVYVFVKDEAHAMLPAEGANFISVQQDAESVIPCLPTSRDVNVTLWQGSKKNSKYVPTNEVTVKFDPTRGFILNFVPITFSGEFYCSATLGDVTDYHVFYLTWLPRTNVVPTPTIQMQSKFAIKGVKFMLNCSVWAPSDVYLFLEWTIPAKIDPERIKIGQAWRSSVSGIQGANFVETLLNVTIMDVNSEDQGVYICIAKDHTGKTQQKTRYLEVKDEDVPYVKFSLGDGDPNEVFEAKIGTDKFQFAVEVESHPPNINLTWYTGNRQLVNSNKHQITNTLTNTATKSILVIYNLGRSDTGKYTLVGTSDKVKSSDKVVGEFPLTLMIVEPPEVSIRPSPPLLKSGESFTIYCHVEGCPGSNITWLWSPCPSPKSCGRNYTPLVKEEKNEELVATTIDGETQDGCHMQNALTGKMNTPGYYMCTAENEIGRDNAEAPVFIKEFRDAMKASTSDPQPFEQDHLQLACFASSFLYSKIQWFWVPKNDYTRRSVTNSSNIVVKPSESAYSLFMDVSINPVVIESSGDYICQALRYESNKWDEQRLTVNVRKTIPPVIIDTNLNGTQYTVFKEGHFEFHCKVSGTPHPVITWHLNGSLIEPKNDTAIQFLENKSKLYIARTLPSDSGRYYCEAKNRAGIDFRNATLKVLDVQKPSALSKGGVIAIVVFIIIAVIVIIVGSVLLGRKIYYERKDKHEWEQMQQQLFDQGDVGSYNPELPLDEQVDTLPYDKSWEVPKERIRLGRVLGQGAFGRVLKGEIHHFVEGEEWTTVAVKMLKERADNEQRRALMQELKIMIHIGRHMNVVNLVGAVTKNICKGELQVLVEYCKYGNLRHFLLKHREIFIDQINTETGEFDQNVRRSGNVFRFSGSIYSNSANNSARTEVTSATVDSAGGLDNNGARFSGLTSPSPNTSRQPSTYDLICYSYQICSGMIYLGSKKLVHRDLALRNILLADGDIVKICDFGLAKDVYRKNYYRKQGQGPLPYKWMAIESMRDKMYTAESDVWSFGILLWEMYTLGANPYPGLEVDDEFYNKLNNGYRMEKPQLAPNSMYQLMTQCWQHEPRIRPTFEEISARMSAVMDADTINNYQQLNIDYMRRERPFGTNSDFLAQLSSDLEAYVGVDPDGADQGQLHYINSDASPQSPVRVNMTTGNVNYANLLHPNDVNGLNHQRALRYGEPVNDRPELAPMIGSGHYQTPPAHNRPVAVNNKQIFTDDQSYLDMGSKLVLNDDASNNELTVRSGVKRSPRSSPPPRYTEVINSDQQNNWNS